MWRNIYVRLAATFAFFFLLFQVVEPADDQESIEVLLSISTFLFAIVFGFLFSNRYSRYTTLKNYLLTDDARLLNIYQASKVFGKKQMEKCRGVIDAYLVAQLDYKLEDYHYTTPTLLDLQAYIFSLKPRTNTQQLLHGRMIELVEPILESDRFIVNATGSRMKAYEWGSLLLLGLILEICITLMPHETLFLQLMFGLLATSVVLLLLVLRRLDLLQWGRSGWTWKPLIRLFHEIGSIPYFPEPIVRSGFVPRSLIKSLKKYRLATYTNLYPDIPGKKVKVVKQ